MTRYYTEEQARELIIPTEGCRKDLIDLSGQVFDRLTVLGYAGKGYWFCSCLCGNITRVYSQSLRDKSTKSCGCYRVSFVYSTKAFGPDEITRRIKLEKPYLSVVDSFGGTISEQWELHCSSCSTTFKSYPQSIIRRGSISCKCSDTYRRSQEEKVTDLRKILNRFSLVVVEDLCSIGTIKDTTRFSLLCKKCDYRWSTAFGKLRRRINGCPRCAGKVGYDTEYFKRICSKIHKDVYDYTLVDYKTKEDFVTIVCPDHGMFSQKAGSHLRGFGCNKCSGGGYKAYDPGFFYVSMATRCGTCLVKFGITNKDPSIRIKQHSGRSMFTHRLEKSWYFEEGSTALALEKLLKKTIPCGVATKQELPDGFTETCSVEHLDYIVETATEFYRSSLT